MKVFKIIGAVERNVVDTFNLEVEAEDPEEAQDIAYEILSNLPTIEYPIKKFLRVQTVPERPISIAIEFQREEFEEEAEVAEEVFSNDDNDDGDDDPPPRYA